MKVPVAVGSGDGRNGFGVCETDGVPGAKLPVDVVVVVGVPGEPVEVVVTVLDAGATSVVRQPLLVVVELVVPGAPEAVTVAAPHGVVVDVVAEFVAGDALAAPFDVSVPHEYRREPLLLLVTTKVTW